MFRTFHLVRLGIASVVVALSLFVASAAHAQERKTNIVVIWGDDIGWYNVTSAPTTTA